MSSRIACSPLTGEIFMGRVNKDGTAFVGVKKNVTSDVMGAVLEKARFHDGQFFIQRQDGKQWVVTVTEQDQSTEGCKP